MEIDRKSLLLTVDTDLSIHSIEKEMNRDGFTLNYLPVPYREILLADALNARLPNLYGEVYGGIEDLCIQIRLAQSDGQVWENLLTPRSATGPDLKKVAIGAAESLGIPVLAVLKIFKLPEAKALALVGFPNEKQESYFLQALRKNQTPVPLWASFPLKEVEPFFHPLGKEQRVLGLSWWGDSGEVQDQWLYFQKLAEQKKGQFYELADEKGQEEWFKDLRHYAFERIVTEVKGLEKISSGHRLLEERVKRIS